MSGSDLMSLVVRRSIIALVVLAALLFIPAGSIGWLRGWLFLGTFSSAMTVCGVVVWRINRAVFEARRRIEPGTARWDRTLLIFLFPMMGIIVPLAALDDGRFHWSGMSWWWVGVGYALMVTGMAGAAWAEAVNRFFEMGVRIQTDRGHHVIDTGPYAIVRHPGYIAANLQLIGMALSLGSWWALIPAGLVVILLLIRTKWEDRLLQAELPGYAEYARRVRYRWIPGAW